MALHDPGEGGPRRETPEDPHEYYRSVVELAHHHLERERPGVVPTYEMTTIAGIQRKVDIMNGVCEDCSTMYMIHILCRTIAALIITKSKELEKKGLEVYPERLLKGAGVELLERYNNMLANWHLVEEAMKDEGGR